MYKDREMLTKLQMERDRIEIEIQKLTYNTNGVSYSEMLRKLVEEFIECSFNYRNKCEKYKLYTKIRGSISKLVGVKTNTYTRSEYLEALIVMRDKYNFIIPDRYKV